MSYNSIKFNPEVFTLPEGLKWIQEAQAWFQGKHHPPHDRSHLNRLLPDGNGLTWGDFEDLSHVARLDYNRTKIPENPLLLSTTQYLFESAKAHKHQWLMDEYNKLQKIALRNRARAFASAQDSSFKLKISPPQVDQTYLKNIVTQIWKRGEKSSYRLYGRRITYTTTTRERLPHSYAIHDPLLLTHEQMIVIVSDELNSLPEMKRRTIMDHIALWGYGSSWTGNIESGVQLMLAIAAAKKRLEKLFDAFITLMPRHLVDVMIPLYSSQFGMPHNEKIFGKKIAGRIKSFKWPKSIKRTHAELIKTRGDPEVLMLTSVPRAWSNIWKSDIDALVRRLEAVENEGEAIAAEKRFIQLSRHIRNHRSAIIARFNTWLNKIRATKSLPILDEMADILQRISERELDTVFATLEATIMRLGLGEEFDIYDDEKEDKEVKTKGSSEINAASIPNPHTSQPTTTPVSLNSRVIQTFSKPMELLPASPLGRLFKGRPSS